MRYDSCMSVALITNSSKSIKKHKTFNTPAVNSQKDLMDSSGIIDFKTWSSPSMSCCLPHTNTQKHPEPSPAHTSAIATTRNGVRCFVNLEPTTRGNPTSPGLPRRASSLHIHGSSNRLANTNRNHVTHHVAQ